MRTRTFSIQSHDVEHSPQCVACEGKDLIPLYSSLLKCLGCGHCYAKLTLSREQLFAIYNEDYFTGNEYENYLEESYLFRKNFRSRLKVLSAWLTPAHRDLLEIGSGYGIFLDIARNHFASATGIDISESATRYAREKFGLDVICGDLLDLDLADRTFDVICMWDTIEHLAHPDKYIEKIGRLARKGALLAITTGDIESLNARWRGSRWRMIHPPSHLHYFSRRSLSRLLERYDFEIIYTEYCGYYRSMRRIIHNIVLLRWKQPKLYATLTKLGLPDFGVYINLYDILYVIARKR